VAYWLKASRDPGRRGKEGKEEYDEKSMTKLQSVKKKTKTRGQKRNYGSFEKKITGEKEGPANGTETRTTTEEREMTRDLGKEGGRGNRFRFLKRNKEEGLFRTWMYRYGWR